MTLLVTRVTGLGTIQDRGRAGHMHEGVAPGGALVPELAVRANRLVSNPDDAALVEVFGELVVRATAPCEVATDARCALTRDQELIVRSGPRRVAYLAVRGGVSAPLLLGSRSTQLSAGLGSRLASGRVIETAGLAPVRPSPGAAASTAWSSDLVITVIPGPDLDAFEPRALSVLASSEYRVSPTSDRVGTRLEGAALRHAPDFVARSRPMVRGAIEVPPHGQPIVLGPEHPTTGGYPILAVVAHRDLAALFSIPLGASLRFST